MTDPKQTGGLPRLEAQMLLLHALGQPPQARAWLLAAVAAVSAPVLAQVDVGKPSEMRKLVPISLDGTMPPLGFRQYLAVDLLGSDPAGLQVLGRLDAKPRHSKASNASDPLHSARSAEVTSLWRLGVAVP